VGVQPFGGRGLSGTGPKAGGPYYLSRFAKQEKVAFENLEEHGELRVESLPEQYHATPIINGQRMAGDKQAICSEYAKRARTDFAVPSQLPSPTGERNELYLRGWGVFACISS